MLSSRLAPPVSIVLPAYNEAAGIVDAIRSMSIVEYPRFEIVIANDGSDDDTLEALIDAFQLELVRIPYRDELTTEPIRAIYRGRSGVDITVVDKENGGRADALNAGINAARNPYVLCTDADVVLDPDCLVNAMQRVVEDRDRTVGVGGNIRPLNGSRVELGHLIEASVPKALIPRMQVLEYVRTFLASRPGWSWLNALPLVSLLGAGLGGLLVIAFVWYYFSPEFYEVGYQPEQPVPYSHALHVGQLGMDCRYCHSLVEVSEHANVPSTQTCMNCHTQVLPEDPRLLPVRQAYAENTPIRWIRVHDLPDYVYFNHSAHVSRGVGCESCHGRVDTMVKVSQEVPLTMGWCLDCHRDPEPNLRDPANVTVMGYTPQPGEGAFVKKSLNLNPPTDCSTCHR